MKFLMGIIGIFYSLAKRDNYPGRIIEVVVEVIRGFGYCLLDIFEQSDLKDSFNNVIALDFSCLKERG